jgi:hypothetical protein
VETKEIEEKEKEAPTEQISYRIQYFLSKQFIHYIFNAIGRNTTYM